MNEHTSIKKEVTKGVFWIAIAKYSGIVIQIIITAILARLISPAAFGTIAVAIVILQFLNIISDIGIGPAVIQYKQLNKAHLDNLFTLTIYIGLFLSFILYTSSNLISLYYGDEVLCSICQMMSLVVFFHSLNVVPNALMRKDKRFRTIALRTLFFQIFSGCIAVWGAFHGWGIYALLVSPILTAIGVFCVNYYNYPLHYVLSMKKEAISMVSSFSIFQFAFSFFNYFSRNLDKLIIGKYFSLTQLGYYDKSYHLMLLPVQNITFVIEPVLHPILSNLQNNKRELGLKNLKLAELMSYISFPIGLSLFFCGGELIKIIYGNQWDAAIPVFKILALSLPLQMIMSTSGAIYQAAGRTNYMFYNGIINTIVTVTGFLIAAIWGKTIEMMAWAWVLTLLFNFINSYWIMYHFALKDINVSDFYTSLIPQLFNSICVFILLSFIEHLISIDNIFINMTVKLFSIFVSSTLLAAIFKQYNILSIIRGYYRNYFN